jgi:superfamily I DNA/RNA helicase
MNFASRKFEPNEQQQALFDFELAGDGSLVFIARAGTGKSTTLVYLLPYTTGTVFMGAFNKKAAVELEEKVFRIHPKHIRDRVTIQTQHAAGLRAFSGSPGQSRPDVKGNKLYTMLDHLSENNEVYAKYRSFLMKLVSLAKLAGFGVNTPEFPQVTDTSAWEHLIEWHNVEDELKDGAADVSSLITVAQGIYVQSLDYCKRAGGPFKKPTIDFDDMLLAPLFYNCKYPKYDRVLIDEAQDTSAVRREQNIRMLAPGGRLIAVGDDCQAIYGFTGADSDALELIKTRLNCSVLPLTVTYRCGKRIVTEAQRWVPDIEAHEGNHEGSVGECFLEPEGDHETPDFWGMGPFTLEDAILCRNTKPLISLAYQFIRKGIPAKVEGRDIGYGLKAIATRWKITELDKLEGKILEWGEKEVKRWEEKRHERKVEETRDKVETLIVLIAATRDRGGYKVQDLVNLIDSMFADTDEGGPRCLTLSTIHKAKGREWRRVFILGMEKYQPSKWAKQDWEKRQEENLMYVAVTRAIQELWYLRVPLATKGRQAGPVSLW